MSFLSDKPRRPKPAMPQRTRMTLQLRHDSPFLGCRFDPEGRFVFAGAQDNTIQRFDLASQQRVAFTGHRSWVRGLAFQAEHKKLLSADWAGKVMIWQYDAANPAPERTIDAHRGWVRAVAVSPDGRTFATCGNDHLVKLWNFVDGNLIREFRGHEAHVYNIAFHPSGSRLVSADLRGVVKDWDVAGQGQPRNLDASVLFRHDNTFRADIGGVRSMAFNGDGSLLACGGITDVTNAFAGIGKPAVVVFNWQTGASRQVLRPQAGAQGSVWGVDFHPDGFLAVTGGSRGGTLWFCRPEQPAPFHTLNLPNSIRDVHFHPDGRRLAIPFYDSSVRIYEMG